MILLVPSMWGIPSGGSVTRSGIWRTARHSAKWPTHNSWMSTRFLNHFLEMWDPQALLVNGVSTNHRTAFAGKIFTGNHVFFNHEIAWGETRFQVSHHPSLGESPSRPPRWSPEALLNSCEPCHWIIAINQWIGLREKSTGKTHV